MNFFRFETYREGLLDYLASVTVFHWDTEIRVLTSKALYALAPFDVEYMLNHVIPALVHAYH